jgi:hypothetical protein
MNKWGIDLREESTKRGIVLAVFGVAALIVALIQGESSSAVLGLGVTLAGSLATIRRD